MLNIESKMDEMNYFKDKWQKKAQTYKSLSNKQIVNRFTILNTFENILLLELLSHQQELYLHLKQPKSDKLHV